MITIVAQQKGGVGKSATAVNVAALLARRGDRVVAVDADRHDPRCVSRCWETIYTMRSAGDMAPHDLALVGESHLLDARRTLMSDGQVEVETEHIVVDGHMVVRVLTGEPGTTDDDVCRERNQESPVRPRSSSETGRLAGGFPRRPSSTTRRCQRSRQALSRWSDRPDARRLATAPTRVHPQRPPGAWPGVPAINRAR